MTSAAATPTLDSSEILSPTRAWVLHLWAFFLPLLNMAFLLTGPHPWWRALLWLAPIWLLVAIDTRAPPDWRQPDARTPGWPFDVQVYLLVAIQIGNHILLGVMASKLAIWPLGELGKTGANLLAMQTMSGVTAGYSGIVVAHELVHRKQPAAQLLGRLLLSFVCYEHFATEHVRGHHRLVGTPDDPATARFGERFRDFFWRTVPGQFKSAWTLENKRLGDERTQWRSLRMLRHRVLQGLVVQAAWIAGFACFFGWIAAVFFLFQARMAIMLLEVVNYVEHWGLQRTGKTVTAVDSWDTDNYFTLYTLVGLSRHADHHITASRPYQLLRHLQPSPKMPAGYYGTIVLALLRNERYIALATAELKRKKLGPFRQGAPLACA